jgi:hypothetical protein
MSQRRKNALREVTSEPAQEPADTTPRLTADQHFRGSSDPIAKAFLHCERLAQQRTRKLTADEWAAEYKLFREAERR